MLEEDMEHPVLPKWLIDIRDSVIKNNQYRGIRLINSSSAIDNVEFLDNPACCSDSTCHNQYGGYGIGVEGGNSFIKNSLIKKHRYGIHIRDEGEPVLENLIFGTDDEANDCNIFKEGQCINPPPEP